MTPERYFREIVSPTVDEYFADRANLRRCILACMTLVHMFDYLHVSARIEAKTASAFFENDVRAACPRARLVYWTAIAGKHAVPRERPNTTIENALKSRESEFWVKEDRLWSDLDKLWVDGVDFDDGEYKGAIDLAISEVMAFFSKLLDSTK